MQAGLREKESQVRQEAKGEKVEPEGCVIMLKRFNSTLTAIVGLAGALAIFVVSAGAAMAVEPLGIKSFSMQTIEGVEERPVMKVARLARNLSYKPLRVYAGRWAPVGAVDNGRTHNRRKSYW